MTIQEYIDEKGFDALTTSQQRLLANMFDTWFEGIDFDDLLEMSGAGEEDITALN